MGLSESAKVQKLQELSRIWEENDSAGLHRKIVFGRAAPESEEYADTPEQTAHSRQADCSDRRVWIGIQNSGIGKKTGNGSMYVIFCFLLFRHIVSADF